MENLKEYFEKQLSEKKEIKFNIFSALHDIKDERRLHSRFIAYLLSRNSEHLLSQNHHHGMENEFLKLFVNSGLNINFDCNNCKVKTEYKNIDILIYNDNEAIIIENKIYAGDSYLKDEEEGFKGQLERYYNSIQKSGIEEENEKIVRPLEIFVVYLTLNGNPPSNLSIGNTLNHSDIICCDYTKRINEWLEKCTYISIERKNNLLSQILNQYKDLVTELTSNVQQALENQKEISEKIDKAWKLEDESKFFTKKCAEIFKHVKWHTVADFINELEEALIKIGAKIIEKPNTKTITSVTHNNSKEKLIIKFKFNDSVLQIVNDAKGFTLGNLTTREWGYFSNKIKDIRFCDFSQEKTFRIINCEERSILIEKIIEEIVSEKYNDLNNNFENLKP